MKNLYVLVTDDGRRYMPCFTLNKEWIDEQQALCNAGELDSEAIGASAGWFSYETVLVPDDATLEALGIKMDCAV